MDPGVKAAWISSMVALCVAVIGVIATGIAQSRGSKTAHANALALFRQQTQVQDTVRAEDAAEQRRIRAEDADERRRTAFLADRRAAYAKFMRAMRELADASTKYEELRDSQIEMSERTPDSDEGKSSLTAELVASLPRVDAAYSARMAAYDEVVLALQEILMLAPRDVSDAAVNWYNARKEDDPMTFALFLTAARADVGVQPLERPPVP